MRLALRADLRRGRRLIDAPEAPVRRAEELQGVAFGRRGRDEPLEESRRAIVLVALQVDARETDPARAIGRIDFGGAAERALGVFDMILIEQPQAEAPVRRRVRGVAVDRAPHVAHGIVGAAEARFDDGQVVRPFRVRRLQRGGLRVGAARGAGEPVRLADHAEAAPPRAVARILRHARARLADDVRDLRRERTEVGKRRRRGCAGAERAKCGDAAEEQRGDRGCRGDNAGCGESAGRDGALRLGSSRSGHGYQERL